MTHEERQGLRRLIDQKRRERIADERVNKFYYPELSFGAPASDRVRAQGKGCIICEKPCRGQMCRLCFNEAALTSKGTCYVCKEKSEAPMGVLCSEHRQSRCKDCGEPNAVGRFRCEACQLRRVKKPPCLCLDCKCKLKRTNRSVRCKHCHVIFMRGQRKQAAPSIERRKLQGSNHHLDSLRPRNFFAEDRKGLHAGVI